VQNGMSREKSCEWQLPLPCGRYKDGKPAQERSGSQKGPPHRNGKKNGEAAGDLGSAVLACPLMAERQSKKPRQRQTRLVWPRKPCDHPRTSQAEDERGPPAVKRRQMHKMVDRSYRQSRDRHRLDSGKQREQRVQSLGDPPKRTEANKPAQSSFRLATFRNGQAGGSAFCSPRQQIRHLRRL